MFRNVIHVLYDMDGLPLEGEGDGFGIQAKRHIPAIGQIHDQPLLAPNMDSAGSVSRIKVVIPGLYEHVFISDYESGYSGQFMFFRSEPRKITSPTT